MAVTALIVSMVALLVSGASAWYTRSQALAATEAAAIERARHRLERTPDFTAEIEQVNSGGWFRLWLTLTSPEALDRIEVTVPHNSGIRFSTSQLGVPGGSDGFAASSYEGDVQSGGRVCWKVDLDPTEYVSPVQLLVSGSRKEDSWRRFVPVDVPFTGISAY